MTQPTPPQAVEAEASLLGALLLDPGAYDRIDWLPETAFYRSAHRLIYSAITGLIEAGRGVDALLVSEELKRRGELKECGGSEYLGELGANTPGSASIKSYAELVAQKAMLRAVQATASEMWEKAQAPACDPKALAEEAESAFLEILEDKRAGEEVAFGRAVLEAIDARDIESKTIPTGYGRLDSMLKGGLRQGQLVVIAGRPGMGKSALAQNIAEHVGRNGTVAYFTLEMSRAEMGERALLWQETLSNTSQAAAHLQEVKIRVDESPAISISHVRLRARRVKRRHGLSLIVVDYLQLMSGKGENRTQEIGSISRGLKAIAKELHVPIIACTQLNRSVEARQDKRPLLSDLRESGDVEQDADVVMMLYRDDYYSEDSLAKGLAECIVRKHRNGPVGTIPLIFRGEVARFLSYEGDLPRPQKPLRSGTVVSPDFKSRAAGE